MPKVSWLIAHWWPLLSHAQLLHQRGPESPFIPEQWAAEYSRGPIFTKLQMSLQRAINTCHPHSFTKPQPGHLHSIQILRRQQSRNEDGELSGSCSVRASEGQPLLSAFSYSHSHFMLAPACMWGFIIPILQMKVQSQKGQMTALHSHDQCSTLLLESI